MHSQRTPERAAVALLAALALVVGPATTALAGHDTTPARIDGTDRFDTAANVAATTYPEGAATVLLARADDYPDALAAASLAGVFGVPVLLTASGTVPERTQQALEDLGTQTVFLLGGTGAISAEVEDGLGERYDVRRLAGGTRFGTAATVAVAAAQRAGVGEVDGQRTALITSGESFADALVAGAPSAASLLPILLTAADSAPAPTTDALTDLGIERAVIVGGEAAVSSDVRDELERRGLAVERLSGFDRTATGAAVSERFTRLGVLDGSQTVLARGDDFPDALAAGARAGAIDAPLLLAATPTVLGQPTADHLSDPSLPPVEVVQAVGGVGAIAESTLADAVDAAQASDEGAGAAQQQTFVVELREERTAAPGDTVEFGVSRRYDGEPFDDTVAIALFPCANVDRDEVITFADDDGDQLADGVADSDTGEAVITEVNGETDDSAFVRAAGPTADGRLTFSVSAGAEDCTVPVVWLDAEPAGELSLDERGRPGEDFGLGAGRFAD